MQKTYYACLARCASLIFGYFFLTAGRAQTPIISSFSPAEGRPLVTYVNICGSNLLSATSVAFGDTAATANFFGPENDRCLMALLPSNAVTGPITVQTPQGNFTTTNSFHVLPPGLPLITNTLPASARPGLPIIIDGENLLTVTNILFNGIPARFQLAGIKPGVEELIVYIPTNATTGPLTVTNPLGSYTTPESIVVDRAGPIITSFSPTSGVPNSGVSIYGSNLVNVLSIAFGGVEQEGVGFTDGLVLTRVGPNAKTGPITITTSLGSFTTADIFTVLPPVPPPPLAITGFSPKSGAPGTIVSINIVEDALNPILRQIKDVQFNGVSASFSYSGPTFPFMAAVPDNATTGPITVISDTETAISADVFTVIQPPKITRLQPDYGSIGTVVQLIGQNLENVLGVELSGIPMPYDPATHTFTILSTAAGGDVAVMTVTGLVMTPVTFRVTHDYELAIGASLAPSPHYPPTTLQYLLSVTNLGSATIDDVLLTNIILRADQPLTDPVAALLSLAALDGSAATDVRVLSVNASQGTCSVTNLTALCDLGSLAGSAVASVQIALEVNRSGIVYQYATVEGVAADPRPEDNEALTTTFIFDLPQNLSFSPTSGTPGTAVEIRAAGPSGLAAGNNLDRVTQVWFGTKGAAFAYDTNRFAITAVVPGDVAGASGPVTLITTEGAANSADSFTALPEAFLIGFSPDHAAPGDVVELLGTNLEKAISGTMCRGRFALTNSGGVSFSVPSNALTGPVTIYLPQSFQRSAAPFVVDRPFDVGLTESFSLTNPLAPTGLHYTVRITNKGPQPVPTVILTNWFAETDSSLVSVGLNQISTNGQSLSISSASASQGRCFVNGAQMVRCELGTLDPFAVATVEIDLAVANRCVVHHWSGLDGTQDDPDMRDNVLYSNTLVPGPSELIILPVSPSLIEIRWPKSVTNWILQGRDELPGSAWAPVQGSTVDVQGWRTLQDKRQPLGRLYRLAAPVLTP